MHYIAFSLILFLWGGGSDSLPAGGRFPGGQETCCPPPCIRVCWPFMGAIEIGLNRNGPKWNPRERKGVKQESDRKFSFCPFPIFYFQFPETGLKIFIDLFPHVFYPFSHFFTCFHIFLPLSTIFSAPFHIFSAHFHMFSVRFYIFSNRFLFFLPSYTFLLSNYALLYALFYYAFCHIILHLFPYYFGLCYPSLNIFSGHLNTFYAFLFFLPYSSPFLLKQQVDKRRNSK